MLDDGCGHRILDGLSVPDLVFEEPGQAGIAGFLAVVFAKNIAEVGVVFTAPRIAFQPREHFFQFGDRARKQEKVIAEPEVFGGDVIRVGKAVVAVAIGLPAGG